MLDVVTRPTRTIRNPEEHPYKEESTPGGADLRLPGAKRSGATR
jgi:hypothetical protein